MRSRSNFWKLGWFPVLSLVQAIASLAWLITIPTASSTVGILGLSNQRLLLATIPLAIAIASAGAVIYLYFHPDRVQQFNAWVKSPAKRRSFDQAFVGALVLFAVLLLSQTKFDTNLVALARLLPILFLGMLLAIQASLFCLDRPKRRSSHTSWPAFLLSAGCFALIALLGVWAGADPLLASPYYSGLGSPILPLQFTVVLFLTAMVTMLPFSFPGGWPSRPRPLLVSAGIFLFALFMWFDTPIPINHFTHATNLAEGLLHPNSDSRLYAINAQQMLLGLGLSSGAPLPRPLYSFFIGLLDLFFGPSFSAVLNVQTFVLALIPPGIYLLGRRIFHPAVGLAAALLFIYRETNQILLSSQYTLSSVRMLMTETLTAGLLVGLLLLAAKWLNKPEARQIALLTGALLGLSALIRTQVLLLGAVIAVAVILHARVVRKNATKPLVYFLLGVLLTVLPWMGRNAIQSDQFVFEDTAYIGRTVLIASGPGQLLTRTAALVTNSGLSSLYQLPWKWNLDIGLQQYVAGELDKPLATNPIFTSSQNAVRLAYLLLICLGLAGAWKRSHITGLLPAGVYLGYGFSSAIAGFSGWRFIQPVDFVVLLYLTIGFVEAINLFTNVLPPGLSQSAAVQKPGLTFKWALVLCLVAGLLLPLGERMFPRQLPTLSQPDLLYVLREHASADGEGLPALAASPNASIESGLLLYPHLLISQREYQEHQALDLWSYGASLLVFDVVSNTTNSYYLEGDFDATSFLEPLPVIVLGCKNAGKVEAIAILAQTNDPYWLHIRQPIPVACE